MLIFDSKKNIRSFGRVNSRKIGSRVEFLLNHELPRYSIDLQRPIVGAKRNYLEVGFGYGESIAARAQVDPEASYIGCETYIRGIANLMKLILAKDLKNTCIFSGDARILLEKLDGEFLDEIFILFPDPWPKRKQKKRRIVNSNFLRLAREKLKERGILFFVSDSRDYIDSLLEIVSEGSLFAPNFRNLEECIVPPAWWVETKYQRKAQKLANEIHFLEFAATPSS
ncbi:MAG: hypothetical protein LBB13_02945 [Rickettsiales bacterium]|jgi:tRNA (guanine-N7-)-methyltransferase|nr:hypothetical protein [Rickettsiales bacterium]